MHENTKTSMSHTVSSERTCRLPACDQGYSDGLIGSRTRVFDWNQTHQPWVT